MNENEIKTRVTADSAKYRDEIKKAQQQLRLLQAELKRDTTALNANASAEDKAAVKAENLRKKIEQQKLIVRAMQDALK